MAAPKALPPLSPQFSHGIPSHNYHYQTSSSPSLPSPNQLLDYITSRQKKSPDKVAPNGDSTSAASLCLPHSERQKIGSVVPQIRNSREQGAFEDSQEEESTLCQSKYCHDRQRMREEDRSVESGVDNRTAVDGERRAENSLGDLPCDVLPPKKRRKTKKCDGNDRKQAKIKPLKIRKPRTSAEASTVSKRKTARKGKPKDTETLLSEAVAKRQSPEKNNSPDKALEQAIRRRIGWTPTRDTISSNNLKSPENSITVLSPTSNISLAPKPQFINILCNYGFTGPERNNCSNDSRLKSANPAIKKKRIELVMATNLVPQPSKSKRSASPKKATTITDKATAPFLPPDKDRDIMSDYLQAPKTLPEAKSSNSSNGFSRKPSRSKQAAVPKVQPLLSPESAMKATKQQSVVFGTCSQLIREDSPTIIQEIQRAIKHSETAIDDDAYSENTDQDRLPSTSKSKILGQTPSNRMWSASTTGFGPSQMNEAVVIEDTPENRPDSPERQPQQPPDSVQATRSVSVDQTSWHDIDDILNLQNEQANKSPSQEKALDTNERESPSKFKIRSQPSGRVFSNIQEKFVEPQEMPNYKGFMEHDLQKAIKAYGIKPIKGRERMIHKLEDCWRAKQQLALKELPPNTMVIRTDNPGSLELPETLPTPPKKRGRPRKAETEKDGEKLASRKTVTSKRSKSTKETQKKKPKKATTDLSQETVDADEIYDSSPPTPSPPRRRRGPAKAKKSPHLSPSPANDVVTPEAEPKEPTSNLRPRLHESITQAITTFPPTHDIQNLTWHEKMLMYDPIVIEDLTLWLNREGLPRINEDLEVDVLLVKEWCESRSVCCLWRENIRGNVRARW